MAQYRYCKGLIKGWLERFPREWGLVLSRDATFRESLRSYYGREMSEDELKQYLTCWLYWFFHDVVKVPEDALDAVDFEALAENLDMNLDELLELVRENYPQLREYIDAWLKKAEEHWERKALSLEEVERLRWPTPEEAAKFCQMFPKICEKYPLVAEYLAQGQISAEEAKAIAEKHPEWFKEVDGYTLRDLWKRFCREAMEEIKREIEEAKRLPEPQRTEKLRMIREKMKTLDYFLDKFRMFEKKTEEKREEPSTEVQEPLPDELEAYLKLLDLNVVRWEKKKGLPEFRRKTAYFVTVIDEGTGEEVTIVWPSPYSRKKYKVIPITNKKGKLVTVLVPIEEAKKKYITPVLITPPKKVQKIISKVEKEVGEDKVEPAIKDFAEKVNWSYVRQILRRMQHTHKLLAKIVERRVIFGIAQYLDTLVNLAKMVVDHLKERVGPIKLAVERVAPEIKLTEAQLRDLWELFCALLAKHGLRCENYADIWANWINPAWDFKHAEEMVYSLVSRIVAEERVKKEEPQLEEPKPKRIPGVKLPEVKGFRWKYLNWGVAHLQFEIESAKHAAKEQDVTDLVIHLTNVVKDCHKMLKLLKRARGG